MMWVRQVETSQPVGERLHRDVPILLDSPSAQQPGCPTPGRQLLTDM